MALLDISLFSDTLQIDISITVIYPQRCDRSPEIPEVLIKCSICCMD